MKYVSVQGLRGTRAEDCSIDFLFQLALKKRDDCNSVAVIERSEAVVQPGRDGLSCFVRTLCCFRCRNSGRFDSLTF